jgi:hypothetical protein
LVENDQIFQRSLWMTTIMDDDHRERRVLELAW